MKCKLIAALWCLSAAAFAAEPATDPVKLAHDKQCLSCHAIDIQAYAPSFQDIARKHTAADTGMLVHKLKAGGRKHWGEIGMPPSGTLAKPLTDQEARLLVQWVLGQKR